VADGITDHVVKTKLHVAVIEHEAGAVSSDTLHPWGYDAMALAQLNSTAPRKEFIPNDIGDEATRDAWCAAYVASAGANSSTAYCEPHGITS
jgi:hypothetical protein